MESLKARLLSEIEGEVRFDEPLKRYTTYRIGGPADILVVAATEDDVAKTLRAAKEHGAPVYVMGSGSNLLINDTGVRGIVLRLGHSMGKVVFRGTTVRAQAEHRCPNWPRWPPTGGSPVSSGVEAYPVRSAEPSR